MKYLLLLLGVFALFYHPKKSEKKKLEEARQRCYAYHQKIAEKIMQRKTWWIMRPGVITENQDGTGELVNFCTSPSAENDFYKPSTLSGFGKLLQMKTDKCPDVVSRAKREWPVQLEVRFEWLVSDAPGKKFIVCNGLLWMSFVDPSP